MIDWWVVLLAIGLYTVIVGLYFYSKKKKDPDGILFFDVSKDPIKASFLLLLPIDEVINRDRIVVEIQRGRDETVGADSEDI